MIINVIFISGAIVIFGGTVFFITELLSALIEDFYVSRPKTPPRREDSGMRKNGEKL